MPLPSESLIYLRPHENFPTVSFQIKPGGTRLALVVERIGAAGFWTPKFDFRDLRNFENFERFDSPNEKKYSSQVRGPEFPGSETLQCKCVRRSNQSHFGEHIGWRIGDTRVEPTLASAGSFHLLLTLVRDVGAWLAGPVVVCGVGPNLRTHTEQMFFTSYNNNSTQSQQGVTGIVTSSEQRGA